MHLLCSYAYMDLIASHMKIVGKAVGAIPSNSFYHFFSQSHFSFFFFSPIKIVQILFFKRCALKMAFLSHPLHYRFGCMCRRTTKTPIVIPTPEPPAQCINGSPCDFNDFNGCGGYLGYCSRRYSFYNLSSIYIIIHKNLSVCLSNLFIPFLWSNFKSEYIFGILAPWQC